jgi:hypothetical protein
VDQPKLEEGKKKKSGRKSVTAEKHFGGACRISREDHWQIIWMNDIAARRSGALTLDTFLCYAFQHSLSQSLSLSGGFGGLATAANRNEDFGIGPAKPSSR